jgi:fatty-acyl-CoA synthase
MTFGRIMDQAAASFGDREALVFEKTRVTYKDLRQRSIQMGKALLSLGVKPDDKVALWMYNCPEWVYTWFGVGYVGAVSVPVNTRFKTFDLEFVLNQSDSTTIVLAEKFQDKSYLSILKKLCPELESSAPGQLKSERLPKLKNVICFSEEPCAGTFDLNELMKKRFDPEGESAFENIRAIVESDSVANIQYTSGSTSFPKGCMLTHDGLVRNGYVVADRITASEKDKYLGYLPLFHNGGSVVTLLSAITKGSCVVLMDKFDVDEALQLIEAEKITILHNVEATIRMLLEAPNREKYDLGSLSRGFSTGPPDLLREATKKLGFDFVCSLYGLSEASPNVVVGDGNDDFDTLVSKGGKPHEGVEVKIIDPSTEKTLPSNAQGEICVRGWNVMVGYYNKPEETEKTIDREGWLHTGDLGVLDEKGYLTFKGRIKEMIRVGGENVSPLEVEGLLRTYPKFRDVQVVGVPDPRLTEVAAAVIQLKEGIECTEEEIIAFCKERLAGFKVPRYIHFVEEFPMTGSGKIPKFKLKEEVIEKFRLGNSG